MGDSPEAVCSQSPERHIGGVGTSLGAKLFQQASDRFVYIQALAKQVWMACFVLRQYIQQRTARIYHPDAIQRR